MPASDKNWYSLKKLHLVFAVSAAALFIATLWMIKKDHKDNSYEWPAYQTTFDEIQIERNKRALQSMTTDEFKKQKKTLEEARDLAQKKIDKNADQVNSLKDQIKNLAHQFDLAKRADKNRKAFWTKAKADRDLAVRDGKTGDQLKPYLDTVNKEYSEVKKLSVDLEEKTKSLNDAKAKMAEITKEKGLASAKLEVLLADLKRVKASQEKLDPEGIFSSWKRSAMKMPIINGFNSPNKIEQVWLPELKIQLGPVRVARFDRCITCHQAEDKVLAGNQPAYPHGDTGTNNVKDWVTQNKYPHPFATHPNTDLYLTSTSPHPMATFGCTICHDGQGSGTNFSNASHTPNSPHQNDKWGKSLNYASNHYWEYPMQPKRFIESSCLKCHHNVTELGVNPKFGATAPKLVRGFELVKKYGCFGCHEIKGFEGNKQFGPDLRLEPST
ncbi:probable cytochrome oxidase (cbb3-type), partial [hydrothermal vent metagenome]